MKTTIIGVAGGSSSGKTTLAEKLYTYGKELGSIEIIRFDDYYKRQDDKTLEERAKTNYDHPNAYDVDLFVSHINALKKGQSIEKPLYDFTNHNRSNQTETIHPANVIIVEGILIFAIPEVLSLFDMKIFVSTPDDIRFIRRLKRDTRDRGRSIESVIEQYLTTVRPMHHQFIEPSKAYADIIVPEGGKNNVALSIIASKIAELVKEEQA